MSDTSSDSPGVVIFPPLLFLLCVALGVLAHLTCPYRLAPSPWLRGLGGVLAVGAIALAIWGRRTMKAAGTNVDPSLPALAIVSGGPFAFTRNPLYLALIVLFTAIGVALADPSFLVFLPAPDPRVAVRRRPPRGALPRRQVRRRLSRLQGARPALDLG